MLIDFDDLYKMFCYGVIYFTVKSKIFTKALEKIPVNTIFTSSLLFGLIMVLIVEGKYIEHMKNYREKKINIV